MIISDNNVTIFLPIGQLIYDFSQRSYNLHSMLAFLNHLSFISEVVKEKYF